MVLSLTMYVGRLALELQLAREQATLAVEGISTNYWKEKDLEHLKIGLDAIKFATENFAGKYYIGSGGYGVVYKAELEHFDSSVKKGNEELELPKRRSMSTTFIDQGKQEEALIQRKKRRLLNQNPNHRSIRKRRRKEELQIETKGLIYTD
ncbi:hypothetical protein L1987_29836 [Smallanthus sonchifolius]|uniref:Uncharacterized protein n=1 Tax=Smallanthus sonchifolius TaxID=185202 RepID=A0ACB9I2B1_9ASTR|nr:hypothetical protein L1987_29836 [Smallanthus sonchifolius]